MNKTQTYTLYLPEDYIDKDDTVIARQDAQADDRDVPALRGRGSERATGASGAHALRSKRAGSVGLRQARDERQGHGI